MSRAVERYALASQSSHMRIDPNCMGAVDILIASGLSRGMAGKVFTRARSEFDASCGRVSAATLRVAFEILKLEMEYLTHAPPCGDTVRRVLSWWLDPRCPICAGAARVRSVGYPNGKVCLACRGTGSKKPPHGEMGRALLAFIDAHIAEHGDGMKRILRA